MARPAGSETTFFNFLASHDGIGLNPARGILSEAEVMALVDRAMAHGGRVSYAKRPVDKLNPAGSSSPYELNINYFDALTDPNSDEPLDTQIDRFVAAHAILFSLAGVPGIYFHSLFGSRGWPKGVELTGQSRTINRQKLDRVELERELSDPQARRCGVFQRLRQLLRARSACDAFHPQAGQRVLELKQTVFAVERTARTRVLCVHNVTAQAQSLEIAEAEGQQWIDLISGQTVQLPMLPLRPYQVRWLKAD